MRVRTLEIRWHDSKPIATADFQPIPPKRARPANASDRAWTQQTYRLATGGEDNHVRIWLVYPNILPPAVAAASTASGSGCEPPPAPRPPRVEYVATLSRHSAAVNVVRFSPNGELLASAGDDGMIIIWAPSSTPHAAAYGADTADEAQYDKEFWKPRTTFRCSTMQVYDLAWSPSGEYIIAGGTDNCARIFTASDGKCVHELAEHTHFVQGVAWDPLNEYVATQSSDRSMHVYQVTHKHGPGPLELHAVGRNSRMPYNHARTPSQTRPTRTPRPSMARRMSTASEAESVVTSFSEQTRDENGMAGVFPVPPSSSSSSQGHSSSQQQQLTPSTSVASTPITSAAMFPPPLDKAVDKSVAASSRRSSLSAPGSPAHPGRYGRSPSPMPALPAIRALPANAWQSVRMYGDESFSNFFRRLNFSPDGGLLLTPAGQFEDPAVHPPSRGRLSLTLSMNEETGAGTANPASESSVMIYSRANFAKPPIAQLPGHKKASIAVRFSPVLYELRQGLVGPSSAPSAESTAGPTAVPRVLVERGREENVTVDLMGPEPPAGQQLLVPPTPLSMPLVSPPTTSQGHGHTRTPSASQSSLHSPATHHIPTPMLSPALSAVDSIRPSTPSRRGRGSIRASAGESGNVTPASVFALPYRMLFAVATMDTVAIHDTQQAGPVALLSKLHYDEFTDMTWSPDGQCLLLAARDGYCTLVVFDEPLPAHHTQQQALQLQSIAQQHAVPMTTSASGTSASGGSKKREMSVPPLSAEEMVLPTLGKEAGTAKEGAAAARTEKEAEKEEKGPPTKKRRVALTRVGDVGS